MSAERLDSNQSAKQPGEEKERELQRQTPATVRGTAKNRAVCALPVRVERANAKNLANPFSYLSAKERVRKLVQLWAEIARGLCTKRNQHS